MAFDLSKLTASQREVYALIRDGKSEKDIAAALRITLRAVKDRTTRLYRALGIPAFTGARRRIAANYQDSLKDCELNCLLAIATLTKRIERLEHARL